MEVENIKAAVRKGKATDTLLEMLVEATAKVGRLRAWPNAELKAKATLQVLPMAIERYLRNLRATLGTDTDRARSMLAGLVGEITLRPRKDSLWAEIRGDPWVLLEDVPTSGAGRGIFLLPHDLLRFTYRKLVRRIYQQQPEEPKCS